MKLKTLPMALGLIVVGVTSLSQASVKTAANSKVKTATNTKAKVVIRLTTKSAHTTSNTISEALSYVSSCSVDFTRYYRNTESLLTSMTNKSLFYGFFQEAQSYTFDDMRYCDAAILTLMDFGAKSTPDLRTKEENDLMNSISAFTLMGYLKSIYPSDVLQLPSRAFNSCDQTYVADQAIAKMMFSFSHFANTFDQSMLAQSSRFSTYMITMLMSLSTYTRNSDNTFANMLKVWHYDNSTGINQMSNHEFASAIRKFRALLTTGPTSSMFQIGMSGDPCDPPTPVDLATSQAVYSCCPVP